jgi:hypothetical protein
MASSLVGVTMMAWGLMHSRPTLYNRSSSASSNIFIKRSTFGAVLNTSKTFYLNISGYIKVVFVDTHHFHANPYADPVPDFYLMRIRMRIQANKMMRIRIHDHNNTGFKNLD